MLTPRESLAARGLLYLFTGKDDAGPRSPPQDRQVTERADVDVVHRAAYRVPAGRHAVGEQPAGTVGDVEDGVTRKRERQDGERLMGIPHERRGRDDEESDGQ